MGSNNIQIKEGDEWKVTFTTPEEVFGPTVIFFGLTNFLTTFQTMMNEIFWDLINMRKVASFIDDIMIRTEEKKGYDKIVEEVVKRLVKNNLYIKPKKYKWKIQKVGFLGVVIEPEGIKIEEEKVKDVLDWPTLKEVKDIQKFLELVNYYHWFIKDFVVITRPLHDMVKKD